MAKRRTSAHDHERDEARVERRAVMGTVELRAGGDEDARTISGYAAVTDQETIIDLGFFAFREKIAPGAFRGAIKTDDVRALFNHDPNIVLGRNKSGTLRLREDEQGLRYDADPPNTQAANDVVELIRRGDVSGSSFAFTVDEADEEWDDEPIKRGLLPLRTIKRVSLYDVSPVTYPAYEGTSVSARSSHKLCAYLEEYQRFRAIREKGEAQALTDALTALAMVKSKIV